MPDEAEIALDHQFTFRDSLSLSSGLGFGDVALLSLKADGRGCP
jgi:hypothetical protein